MNTALIAWSLYVNTLEYVAVVNGESRLLKTIRIQRKRVRENLKKIGHVTPEVFQPILGSKENYFYRNKLSSASLTINGSLKKN